MVQAVSPCTRSTARNLLQRCDFFLGFAGGGGGLKCELEFRGCLGERGGKQRSYFIFFNIFMNQQAILDFLMIY
jgi:hypothetical protein